MEKFFKMPKSLFTSQYSDLSSDAKLLYMLISDRFQLSLANDWKDSSGRTFCYFKREDMMNMLGLSAVSVRKLMKQLQEHNLIEEIRQGFGKPNRIYILSFDNKLESDIPEEKADTDQKKAAGECKEQMDNINQFGATECDSHESNKLSTNKTEINNINTVQTESDPDQSRRGYKASAADWNHVFKATIAGPFIGTEDEAMADSIVELMSETMVSGKSELKIHGEMVPIEMIKSRFAKLTSNHIRYVIDSIRTSAVRKIYNLKSYMLTCLYESVTTMQTYYINAVNCAFADGIWYQAY